MRGLQAVRCRRCHRDEMRFKVMLYDDDQVGAMQILWNVLALECMRPHVCMCVRAHLCCLYLQTCSICLLSPLLS